MTQPADALRQGLICMGLPDAGKTTFLVALYHVVESGEVAGSLLLKTGTLFEADRDYIQRQREKWLDYKPLERNKVDAKGPIVLSLVETGASTGIRLDLPDLSGETFRIQVDQRSMAKSLCDRLSAADGLVLFVNPDKVVEPTSIVDVDDVVNDLAPNDNDSKDDDSKEDDSDEGDDAPDMAFSPEKSCTAAKLVELLQFALPHVRGRPVSVAVVVSAFDLLEGTPYRDDPDGYFRTKLALVQQYLEANKELFRYGVFGLSAQGADYADAAKLAEVADRPKASDRIRVAPQPPTGPHDITHVIRWFLEQHRLE